MQEELGEAVLSSFNYKVSSQALSLNIPVISKCGAGARQTSGTQRALAAQGPELEGSPRPRHQLTAQPAAADPPHQVCHQAAAPLPSAPDNTVLLLANVGSKAAKMTSPL